MPTLDPHTDSEEKLRRCNRDLVALTALPATWNGASAADIAGSLAEVLISLLRSDIASVQVHGRKDSPLVEAVRTSWTPKKADLAEAAVRELADQMKSNAYRPTATIPDPRGEGVLRVIANPIGFLARHGMVIVGSSRAAFPDEIDSLLLSVACNQASIALEGARLLAETQESVTARDEFLSVTAHEVRTPLTSLRLQLQMLERLVKKEGGKASKLVGDAERQVDRLSRLVDELLDLTKIRLGRLKLDLQKADLVALAREGVERFREEAARTGSKIAVRAEGVVSGRWDRARLEQVIANLLSNAIKYGEGKPIEIAVFADGRTARLEVRDQGIGIAPEDQGRIFQRFQRAEGAKRIPGLGLGLYVVREIVEAHGGRVRVTSRPAAGSTFAVDLPAGR